jgi:hypothetical protein
MSHKDRVKCSVARIKRGEYTSHERIIMRMLADAPVGLSFYELLAKQTISKDRLEYVLTSMRRAGVIDNGYRGGPLGRWCTPDRVAAAKAYARAITYGPESNEPGWSSKREQNKRAAWAARRKAERKASPALKDADERRVIVVSAADARPLHVSGPASVFQLAAVMGLAL